MPHRSRTARAARAALLSAGAIAPAALLAGCSLSSGAGAAPSATATASPTASVRYATLPDPCGAISRATLKSLVPGAKSLKGSEAGSGQPKLRGGCSWNGLHGYQYRYLDASFQRFDTLAGAAPADTQATTAYHAAVRTTAGAAQADKGKATTAPLPGLDGPATLIVWQAAKSHASYHTATIVVRSANAVVTIDYTGAGLQGDHAPKTSDLRSGAEQAAKQALAALG